MCGDQKGAGEKPLPAGADGTRLAGTYFGCSSTINNGLHEDSQICVVLFGTVPFDTNTKPRRSRVIKRDFKSQKLPGPIGGENNVLIFSFLKGERIGQGIQIWMPLSAIALKTCNDRALISTDRVFPPQDRIHDDWIAVLKDYSWPLLWVASGCTHINAAPNVATGSKKHRGNAEG